MSFWCLQISQKTNRNPGKNFVGFLGDLKTPKGHFEINWPLPKMQIFGFLHRFNYLIIVSTIVFTFKKNLSLQQINDFCCPFEALFFSYSWQCRQEEGFLYQFTTRDAFWCNSIKWKNSWIHCVAPQNMAGIFPFCPVKMWLK